MFKTLIDNKKLGGVTCIIWKDGQVKYQESYGYKNLETYELMTIDTIFRIASMTKPITSVLAMMLYEEKKLNLNDPVTKWFPQFRNMNVLKNLPGEYEDANRLITVLDLLTHRAGFTYSGFLNGKLKDDYESRMKKEREDFDKTRREGEEKWKTEMDEAKGRARKEQEGIERGDGG